MKISLSNPGFWLRCLFEFIFCSCVRFIMVMKCWIKIVWDGRTTVSNGKRRRMARRGTGGSYTSLIKHLKKFKLASLFLELSISGPSLSFQHIKTLFNMCRVTVQLQSAPTRVNTVIIVVCLTLLSSSSSFHLIIINLSLLDKNDIK